MMKRKNGTEELPMRLPGTTTAVFPVAARATAPKHPYSNM